MSAPDEQLTVQVDRDRCVGTGGCVFAAEDVFEQRDEDGRVALLQAHPDASRRSAIEEAAAYCPVSAIRLLSSVRLTEEVAR